jgi:hypothetical protein
VAAAALLISLFAPWYRESISARGLHGVRTLTLTQSGWDAFGFTGATVLVVAILALALAIAIPVTDARVGHGRLRLSGAAVAVLGAIAFVVVLARLATAPGTTHDALATTTLAIRWGIFLALIAAAVLTVAGLRLLRAPQPEASPDPRSSKLRELEEWPTRRSARQPTRSPRSAGRAPRTTRVERPDRAARPATPPRRTERPRSAPTPAAERQRPRWEEGSTSWLDPSD